MRTRSALLVAALTLAVSRPALAWDPFLSDGAAAPAATPAPPGLYLVTDVYAGDTVTTTGATTRYGTVTVRDTPGTYARVLRHVSTGQADRLEGSSLNARARLPDGRLVAGTYYEDFVLTAKGFVAVNIVFFQDDSLTTPASALPIPTATPSPAPATAGPRATSAPTAAPVAHSPAPVVHSPAPVAHSPAPARPPAVASAGVALAPTTPVLGTIEVLRGRHVWLWPRAFVNGRAVTIRSWRLVAPGGATVVAASGDGATPCDAMWLGLAAPGSAFTATFQVSTDALPGRVLDARIDVVVRSPALFE